MGGFKNEAINDAFDKGVANIILGHLYIESI